MENKIIDMTDACKALDDLKNTRDYSLYLKALYALKNRFLIIASVKDTFARASDKVLNLVKEIGFSEITSEHHRTYIGIIDRGNVVFNQSAEAVNIPIEHQTVISDMEIYVSSKSLGKDRSEIIINSKQYSMSSRGLNIVVYDYETSSVIDSSTYDSWLENPLFFHKLLWLDEEYFNSHFYLREDFKAKWYNFYQRNYFSNQKLSFREIENGIIEPVIFNKGNKHGKGGCCDKNFNFVAGDIKMRKNTRDITESYVPEGDIEYVDETVIYIGNIFNHPGHIIAEANFMYLWYIAQNPECTYKLAFTHFEMGFDDDNKFIYEFFEAFGILDRVISINKVTQFKKIIVPDQGYIVEWYPVCYSYTTEVVNALSKFTEHIVPSEYRKIFFAKNKTKKGGYFGEEFLVEFYKNKGFEIIYPEDYSIKEKIALMKGADEFVTYNSTNILFAMFCKPDVKLTILSSTMGWSFPANPPILNIAEIKNITIVDVSLGFLTQKPFVRCQFFVGVTEQFKNYVRNTYFEEIEITQEEYLKNNLYGYLMCFIDFYTSPSFNNIKNQKMLETLQYMSQVFYGKALDTSQLNLKTNEDALNEQVKKLTKELDAAKGKIKTLESRVAEESEIKLLSANAETTNELLEKQFSDIKKLLKKKNRNQDFYEQQIEELKAAIEQKNCEQLMKQIDELKKKNKSLEKKVKSYEQSKSWKITKPLRSIAGFFRKLFGKG